MSQKYLTTNEYAELTGISPNYLRKMAKEGRIANCTYVAGCRRFVVTEEEHPTAPTLKLTPEVIESLKEVTLSINKLTILLEKQTKIIKK